MSYTTINKSSLNMNTKLYTGTGSSNALTGINFQPDLTWIKKKDGTNYHVLTDAVRLATKQIYSNDNGAEETVAEGLKSFDSDGFTLGTNGDTNGSGGSYVGWNWKANGAGSANTDGSINSTVSVNQTAGFSIVKWTGTGANATIGHGLGSVPKMIIAKALGASNSWGVYHVSTGANKYMYLDSTQAKLTNSAVWNDTTPTSSVFSVGTSGASNESGEMIAYCFSDVRGYQKIGNYCGQTTGENPFVQLGFKPQFILIKNQDAVASWRLVDNKRIGYNPNNIQLYPNLSNAESTSEYVVDILSNGFKVRATDSGVNGDGNMMIYYAVGQSLVGDNNVPCTAR